VHDVDQLTASLSVFCKKVGDDFPARCGVSDLQRSGSLRKLVRGFVALVQLNIRIHSVHQLLTNKSRLSKRLTLVFPQYRGKMEVSFVKPKMMIGLRSKYKKGRFNLSQANTWNNDS